MIKSLHRFLLYLASLFRTTYIKYNFSIKFVSFFLVVNNYTHDNYKSQMGVFHYF